MVWKWKWDHRGKKDRQGFLGELKSLRGKVDRDHREEEVGGLREEIQNVFFRWVEIHMRDIRRDIGVVREVVKEGTR